jgi:hypothetical protein
MPLSEYSLEHFARLLDLAGERTKEASEHSARPVEAIMQRSTALSGESKWSRANGLFARNRVSCQRHRATQALRARSPQDLAVIQTEMLRDDIVGFLQSSGALQKFPRVSPRISSENCRTSRTRQERVTSHRKHEQRALGGSVLGVELDDDVGFLGLMRRQRIPTLGPVREFDHFA